MCKPTLDEMVDKVERAERKVAESRSKLLFATEENREELRRIFHVDRDAWILALQEYENLLNGE